jgi:hypothetical protein
VVETEREKDQQICTDENTAAFVCATTVLTCKQLKVYLIEKVTQVKFAKMQTGDFIGAPGCFDTVLDCCEQPLVNVINACPNSFTIE